jgi:MFS family permease
MTNTPVRDDVARGASAWADRDFRLLWGAQTLSQFGTQIGALALPLTAVSLGAEPLHMGLLAYAQYVPYLFVSLLAGAVVDRSRRRPLLVGTDLGRGALLLAVPAFALAGVLRLEHIYAIALVAGALTVLFEVAWVAYLPSLVRRDQLVDANARLSGSASAAQLAGPGIAGMLVQVFSAPMGVVIDATTYLGSAALIRSIRRDETPPSIDAPRDLRGEIVEGLRVTWRHPIIRALALASLIANFFIDMHIAVVLLYFTRTLELNPFAIGLVYSIESAGALAGAVVTARLTRRFGLGPAVIAASLISASASTLIAFVGGPMPLVIAQLGVLFFAWTAATTVYVINATTVRQLVTPDRLQGRVTASVRFVTWGFSTLGFLAGGVLGELVDLRAVVLLAGLGALSAVGFLLLSPVPQLRSAASVATAT